MGGCPLASAQALSDGFTAPDTTMLVVDYPLGDLRACAPSVLAACSPAPMARSYLRLRQIALVARTLEPVERQLTSVLATEVCYRDPGVGKYGLRNALWALGGSFLEVVSPIRDNTAGGRYLDRRGGDGGYMYIVDCDDLDERRAQLQALGIRIVEDVRAGDAALWSEAIHLHPRDTGGCLLSVDRHAGGADTMGGYLWAGADWQSKARRDVMISGAVMQCDDPAATAERWARLLRRPVAASADGGYELPLDHAVARFVPLADDRGEGLTRVLLSCAEPASLLAAATANGAAVGSSWFDLCGVRFELGHRIA
jgi:Glyoxalase-like domain